MDVFKQGKRSWIMSRVKGVDTVPERLVRSLLHRMGYRFRLHRKDLPGNPDIVLPRHHKIIFVHGCFWHGHRNCPRAKKPTTNIAFWKKKIDTNVARDRKNIRMLQKLGWDVLVVWQCELKNMSYLTAKIKRFLGETGESIK